jgi:galactokinase
METPDPRLGSGERSLGRTSPSPRLHALLHKSEDCLAKVFQSSANVVACAPGRVNLLGEHIDYNDGIVLPFAIDRHIVVAIGTPPDGGSAVRLWSDHGGISGTIGLDGGLLGARPDDRWLQYPWGVARGFQQRGAEMAPFIGVIVGDLPVGGGLSSSAALEVAFALALAGFLGHTVLPMELAILCQCAEQVAVDVPCGLMDQVATIFGRANSVLSLDCQSNVIEYLPWDSHDLVVLVTDTGVRRQLAEGKYRARRQSCRDLLGKLGWKSFRQIRLDDLMSRRSAVDDMEYRLAHHVVTEIDRVDQARLAILKHDWEQLGGLMFASHASLRDDYDVSWPVADALVELARSQSPQNGVLGCRMTGGGFGGCIITLVRRDQSKTWQWELQKKVQELTGRTCWQEDFLPAQGARVIMQQGSIG